MGDLLLLCTDLASEVENERSSRSVVLEDVLKGIISHRILKFVDDDQLKFALKSTNQLLNERKTRTRGLMLFENFIQQVDSDRLVAVQDQFLSSLKLISKCADLALTHRILVTLIPICNKLPEFNQCVVTSIVPKVITHICEKTDDLAEEEVESLIMCLEKYRGPCGHYKIQLEKFLFPFIDGHLEDVQSLAKVFPLLSCVGGGGNKGEKYTLEWNRMATSILVTLHDSVVSLYGDVCPMLETSNPYGSAETGLSIPSVLSPDVLVRASSLGRRLSNLSSILGAYLSEPFPAAKPVPVRGIVNFFANATLLNPITLLGGSESAVAKENIFLSALLPKILISSFNLLEQLIKCCGSQILPEASRIELQTLQQLKWIGEKPHSFQNVKIAVYNMLKALLETSRGFMSSEKNAHAVAVQIFRDIAIEKQSIILSKNSTPKGKKPKGTKGQVTSMIQTSGEVRIETKSEEVCCAATEVLRLLLPSLDPKDYREAYMLVASNTWDILRSSERLSPYCSAKSRSSILACLAEFAISPHPQCPVSVGLITNLLEYGARDSQTAVSSHCEQLLGSVERIINPPCASLNFPVITPAAISASSSVATECFNGDVQCEGSDMPSEDEEEIENVENRVESFCQTEELFEELNGSLSLSNSLPLDASFIKEVVADAFKENLDEFRSILARPEKRHSSGRHSRNGVSFHRGDHAAFSEDDGSTTEEERGCKRPKANEESIKPRGSHLVAAEEVHKELKIPLPKTNGYSNSKDLDLEDEEVGVSVEEILLSFDDQIVVSAGL